MNVETPPRPIPSPEVPALLQVGALTIRFRGGAPEVLLLTSRETKRWVIPKGWPMKGRTNWYAAAKEAREEAGVVGKTGKRSVGDFLYYKRRALQSDLCRVEVYPLLFEKQLRQFREKGQREARWFDLEEAAERVQEPGLAALMQGFDAVRWRKPKKAGRAAR
jgi:8-oxo-dGTP pyrophosphatase MutT (NUDIX family)